MLFESIPIKQRWLSWSLLGVIILLSIWLRSYSIRAIGLNYDEGHWLMFGLLVNAGHSAYSETFVGIPPLALLVIQLGAKLFGTDLVVRYPMMLFSLVGVSAIFWMFRPTASLFNLCAGMLAACLLAFNPFYFDGSVSIMAEVPAVAMSILSLALAQHYYLGKRLIWLFLSGVTFTLGLAFKVFVIFLPVLIGTIIFWTAWSNRGLNKAMVKSVLSGSIAWVIGAIIPLLVFVVIYEPGAMYRQVLGFRFALRQVNLTQYVSGEELNPTTELFVPLFVDYLPLIILALLGALLGRRRRGLQVVLWLSWLILAIALLVWHTPFRERYFVLLIPPLAALTGLLLAWGAGWLLALFQGRWVRFSWVVVGLALLSVIIGVMAEGVKKIFVPPFADSGGYVFGYLTEELRDAIDYAKEYSLADDWIITDDQRIAIAAHRLVPPALSETSQARLLTGWQLDADKIVEQADAYDSPLVVYKANRFKTVLPDLAPLLDELYFLKIIYTDQIIIYTVKKEVEHQPDTPLDVRLGENILLKGFDFISEQQRVGHLEPMQLATYWRALKLVEQGYKIFLQLRNSRNDVVASFDHFPFEAPTQRYQFMPKEGGYYQIIPNITYSDYRSDDLASYPGRGMVPTNSWPVDQTIREVTTLKLPADLPEGDYQLYLGLYDPDTGERLAIDHGGRVSNEVLLTSVEIVKVDE